MGNCLNKKSVDLQDCNQQSELEYSYTVQLRVKQKDIYGRQLAADQVIFSLTSPIKCSNRILNTSSGQLGLSMAVLPGLDPRQYLAKECQDNIFISESNGAFFAGLFDGHGKEGATIVEFCAKTMQEYFQANTKQFEVIFIQQQPIEQIKEVIEVCDSQLKSGQAKIDCSLSGTTAVLIYVNNFKMYVGSVGDSRAILASIPSQGEVVEQQTAKQYEPFKRPVQPARMLKAEQLTVDQKPNNEHELKRIQESGGKVERLTDERGKRVGPYRVWKREGNIPGLAMSRSIGDKIASEVGVISNPITNEFDLYAGHDQFLVMSSDGVWDVMENYEVVNFVERFRKQTISNPSTNSTTVRPNMTTISHLLAEEARYRWFGIIEEEDVMIDDISVLIIEMSQLEPTSGQVSARSAADRKALGQNSIAISEPTVGPQTGTRVDPRRGSTAQQSQHVKGMPVRRDPARGSMVDDKNTIEEEEEDIDESSVFDN